MSLTPVSFSKRKQPLPRLSKPYEPGKRDDRYWRESELDVIRKYYPQGGASACLAHLAAHRTPSGVYQQARKLDLKAPFGTASDKTTAKKVERPADFDQKLREFYQGGDGKKRGECNDFADRLGIPRWWVTKRATELGLTLPHKKEPPWTAAEDALMSKVPLHNPDRCAEIFRENGFSRSPSAIMVHAKRIGISRRFNEGLSARQAAKIIGIDDKGITAHCISGDLKAAKRDDNRLPQQGGSRWVIKPADLRQFVVDNLGHIDFRKVDKFAFVRLLITEGGTGGGDRSGWTVAEDNIVKGGYARRLTITQLIDELEASGFKRRSAAGISGRAKFLGCLSERASAEWVRREDEILRAAYEGGVRIADIVGLLEDEGFKRTRGAIQMRAIVLRISVDRVNYWSDEEKAIAIEGLRAGKTHGEVREELAAAGYMRGPTAMFKFAQKHRVVRKHRDFTESDIETIRTMFGAGRSHAEISAKLDRTRASIASQCCKMGLKHRRPWTEAERQTLVDYHARGETLKAAAAAVGRPYANVAAECGRMGLSFLKPSTERTFSMTKAMTIPLVDIEADDSINARRTRTDDGIPELKASIRAHGLIQALRVRQDEATGKAKIIAGHRRHRVLCELATDGDTAGGVPVDDAFPVPVVFGDVDDRTAIELSQAENFIKLPPHEADTYETFRELADRGLDEHEIAARFGIEPKRVKRMLALGRLSPMILEAWRGGKFERDAFDVVRSFTLAPSIEDQERVFKKLTKENRLWGGAVRGAFGAGDQEAAKHIKIAGLEAYRAAGGAVTTDLFGDNHVISDKEIAKRVAEEKIAAVLEGLRTEGWSWVSMTDDLPNGWSWGWSKEKPSEGKMTAGEKKQIKKLEKAIAKGTEGAADELATLQKDIAGRQWTPEQFARAGAALTVSYSGDLQITRGLIKPAKAKQEKSSGKPEKGAPTISNAMAFRLSVAATKAAQEAMVDEPRNGLVALLAGFHAAMHNNPIKVSLSGYGHSRTGLEPFSEVFARFQQMTDAELFAIAAGIASHSVDMQSQNALRRAFEKGGDILAAAIDADRMTAALRANFDPADYFAGVAKPFVIQAIREAVNEDEAKKADKLKKKELVEYAVKNVQPTGWLPPELRCATYSGPGEVPVLQAAPQSDDDPVDDADDAEGLEDEELEDEAA